MRFVAFASQQPQLTEALTGLDDNAFSLFPIPTAKPIKGILDALAVLEFAGIMLLDETLQRSAFPHMQRSSLDAQEAGAVDTVTITPAGLFGDYTLGHALGSLLRAHHYDAREAKAVVLGANSESIAVARELSSLGVSQLTLVAATRPDAEKTLPSVAASTVAVARAIAEPTVPGLIEAADILVRVGPTLEVPEDLMGPHLTVVDFAPQAMSSLRQTATRLGAKTFGLRDVQSHQLALSLTRLLGKPFKPDAFLTALLQ